MEKRLYRIIDDNCDNYVVSITEDQKRVFEWFIKIGYEIEIIPLDLENIIEI